MNLLIFWIKAAIKRILNLSKPYLFMIFLVLIFVSSFIYAFMNGYISIILDIKTIYIIVSLMIIFSLFNSIKNYDILPYLIRYSKSSLQNKIICLRFFIKKALKNNLLLILFNIIAFYLLLQNPNDFLHIFIILGITICSIFLSFMLMLMKYYYLEKIVSKKIKLKIKLNPAIKSALNDYLSSDFFISFVLSIVLLIIFTASVIRDADNFYELKNNSYFFIVLTLIFSFGFAGIISSIPNINWKFMAIISINSFSYHFKRTFFVLLGFFGWLILLFIISGRLINITLTFKYLYCLLIILFSIINVSLTITNMIIKIFILSFIIIFTVWISMLSFYFLPVLIIPLILTFIKSKNEYKEWSLL